MSRLTIPEKLDFKYCECGCKSYTASFAGLSYRIFWDLDDTFHLYNSSGPFGREIGEYKTMGLAEEAAMENLRERLR